VLQVHGERVGSRENGGALRLESYPFGASVTFVLDPLEKARGFHASYCGGDGVWITGHPLGDFTLREAFFIALC